MNLSYKKETSWQRAINDKKTKQAIEDAMVQLLAEQPFDQISTVKLAETAGINRSSFYTHYKDKYDMIDHYQSNLFGNLEDIFEKYANNRQQVLLEIFKYLQFEPLLAALLSKNETKESPQEITEFLFPLTNAVREVFSKK